MVLKQVYTTAGKQVDVTVANGLVAGVDATGAVVTAAHVKPLYFPHHLVFPGLINSHDHLHFNLFPRLGNRLYPGYIAWGEDIHLHNKETIAAVLAIPEEMRTQWGIYKNLLNGVTTVVHHGKVLQMSSPVIDVFTHCHSLHSVGLEKRWQYRLNKPFLPDWPFVIHIGEGTDEASYHEINRLIRWNLRKRKLIGIHGVAMQPKQARAFAALVWCPDSNLFLLGATAAADRLKKETAVLFGTDSTVSAGWSIWDQLRLARDTGMLTDIELMQSVMQTPAKVWELPGKGRLIPGAVADLVVTRMKKDKKAGTAAFFATEPDDISLVMKAGRIVLFEEALLPQLQLKEEELRRYSKVTVGDSCSYVWGDVPGLLERIRQYHPAAAFPVTVV